MARGGSCWSTACARLGSSRWHAVIKAQVLVRGLIVEEADPAADTCTLERLAIWIVRFMPVAVADLPDGAFGPQRIQPTCFACHSE
jgi:hypothetical protein